MTAIALKRKPASPDFTDIGSNEDVYNVYGSYGTKQFRVPAGTPVTIEDGRFRSVEFSDPRRTLPNMEVKDGAMVIPLCDIVEEIVARSEPVDLAKALWENDDVRQEFIYCCATRYNESNIGDADRRKLLTEIKEVIHSVALDKLADAMCGLEYEARKIYCREASIADFRRFYCDVLDTLGQFPDAHAVVISRHGSGVYLRDATYEEFKIGGHHWCETREFWRKKCLEFFPEPEAPQELADDLDR
jgi:hypothetical protein